MDTTLYRQQHDRISVLAGELAAQAGALDTPGAAMRVLRTLDLFTAELSAHLQMEDNELYPALMAHPDAGAADLARTYFNEMGGITDLFGVYRARWTSSAIGADPDRFARETALLIEGLADRIRRENEDLYVAAERLDRAAA